MNNGRQLLCKKYVLRLLLGWI